MGLNIETLEKAEFRGPIQFSDGRRGMAQQDFDCPAIPRFGFAWRRENYEDEGRRFHTVDGREVSSLEEALELLSRPPAKDSPNEILKGILEDCAEREEKRAKDMPDEKAALGVLFEAYKRLEELGWSNAVYCPKDGSMFNAIEAGSTGIHTASYQGEWPKGSWWIHDDGDMSPSYPILYKLKPDTPP